MERCDPLIQNWFFEIFANPFVCYILLMLGLYLLLFGISSEEGEMIVGAVICLALSIFGITVLGIGLSSIILFIVGVTLFIMEAYTEASLDGVLAIAGIVCVIAGGAFFIQSLSLTMTGQEVLIMWITLMCFTVTLAVIFGAITFKVIEIKKQEAVDKFVPEPGDVGVVKSAELKPEGQVYLKGEDWSAECIEGYYAVKGDKVQVVKVEGVHLIVRPLED